MKLRIKAAIAVILVGFIFIVISKKYSVVNIYDEIGLAGRRFFGIPYTNAHSIGTDYDFIQPDILKYDNAIKEFYYYGIDQWTVCVEVYKDIACFFVYSDTFLTNHIQLTYTYDINEKYLSKKIAFYASNDEFNIVPLSVEEVLEGLDKDGLDLERSFHLAESSFELFLNYWIESNGSNSKFSIDNYGTYESDQPYLRYADPITHERFEVAFSEILAL